MKVNGLTLPASFMAAIAKNIFSKPRGPQGKFTGFDAYGNWISFSVKEVYQTLDDLLAAQEDLPIGFEPYESGYGYRLGSPTIPGTLPDITDFSRVICFGVESTGAPFCFDYRENIEQPSIIYWDDLYWRCIAPDFDHLATMLGWVI